MTLDTTYTTADFDENEGQAISGKKPAQKSLGRGLAALIGESKSSFVQTDESQQMIATGKLAPSKFQPRHEFNDEKLKELAESISKNGMIQPIIVRPKGTAGDYEIIAGERRWRAAKSINLPSVPVIIKELVDKEVMELALVENIQREDLSPLEEAQAYRRLLGEFAYSQEELHRTVGKSRSHIANLLRLLSLPEEIKTMLQNGDLTMGHARALLGCSEPVELAERIVSEGLSVRQTEELAREDINKAAKVQKKTKEKKAAANRAKDPDIIAIEEMLTRGIGSKVQIKSEGRKGEIKIAYDSLEQLDSILQRLGKAA